MESFDLEKYKYMKVDLEHPKYGSVLNMNDGTYECYCKIKIVGREEGMLIVKYVNSMYTESLMNVYEQLIEQDTDKEYRYAWLVNEKNKWYVGRIDFTYKGAENE